MHVSEIAQKFSAKDLSDAYNFINNSPKSVKVHCCVEKSCQTFAKRLTQTLIVNNNEITAKLIVERLEKELKRLHQLILSYSKDFRFKHVNFKLVHSRFATLVMAYLKKEGCDKVILDRIRCCLDKIDVPGTKEYILCLCWRLKISLGSIDTIEPPELLFTEKECEEAWNNESLCSCNFLADNQVNQKRHKKNHSGSYRRPFFERMANDLSFANTVQEKCTKAFDLWAMRDQPRDCDEDDSDDVYFVSSFSHIFLKFFNVI